MTYRLSHHSTSDDSTKYRDRKEVEERAQFDNPITRLRRYLENKQCWDKEKDESWRKEIKNQVLTHFAEAEKKKKPSIDHMFTDVYDELPPNLIRQKQELEELIKKYPEYYTTDEYASSS